MHLVFVFGIVVVVNVLVDFQLFTDGMAPKFFLTSLSHVSTLSTLGIVDVFGIWGFNFFIWHLYMRLKKNSINWYN